MAKNKAKKGIKIRMLNAAIIVAACILYLLLLHVTAFKNARYFELAEQTKEYIACERSSHVLYQASDYLTEQVRLFAQNMDIDNMNLYFEEANETKRRENAIKELVHIGSDEAVLGDLWLALDSSNDLMEVEMYSMKLICEAKGYDEQLIPQEVRNVRIKSKDAALSSEDKIEKARELVFNKDYQNAKNIIYGHLSNFVDDAVVLSGEKQLEGKEVFERGIIYQWIFIIILALLTVFNFVAITRLVVKPLGIHVGRVKENKLLDVIGSYEMRYLAYIYNDVHEMNRVNNRMLKDKAEHDSLTGLLNRNAFENLKEFYKNDGITLALVVVDVDKFKHVNDGYGHEVGDEVIKTVADTLKRNFRPEDFVIRLGGDEFVVLMTEGGKLSGDAVRGKLIRINEALKNPQKDIPPVTISAGVAFSEEGFTEDLFAKADKALYEAKEGGRSRCCFAAVEDITDENGGGYWITAG